MKNLNELWVVDQNYKPTYLLSKSIEGISERLYSDTTFKFISYQHAFQHAGLTSEDFVNKSLSLAKKPFEGGIKMLRLTHSMADFKESEVKDHNNLIGTLRSIQSLEELHEKFPEAVHCKEMGYWGMHHGHYNRPPYVKQWNASTINPPHSIRYAKGGEVSEDSCWCSNGVVYYTKKGDLFEHGIN